MALAVVLGSLATLGDAVGPRSMVRLVLGPLATLGDAIGPRTG